VLDFEGIEALPDRLESYISLDFLFGAETLLLLFLRLLWADYSLFA